MTAGRGRFILSPVRISQIAAQLYTVRNLCKTPDDLAKTLSKLREIGYEAVQVSGVPESISAGEIRRLTDAEGLKICATHEPGDRIRREPAKVVERLHTLGTAHTAYPYPADVDFNDVASVKAMVSDLDAAGAVLRENGCTLSYHNHAVEFLRIGDETLMDYIFRATASENLAFELDTYWVQAGGCDPIAWIRKVAGRCPLLHLKDFGYGADNKPFFAEVGSGNLNMPGIIEAAAAGGTEWFIVEQDTCPGDPLVSLEISFRYLSGLAAK